MFLEVPRAFPTIAGGIYFIDHFCGHLNVPFSLGWLALWFMNP
jgi:hypothetical protein